MGTARFLIWMTAFVVVWVVWNRLGPDDLRWDDYPFIFLTLMLQPAGVVRRAADPARAEPAGGARPGAVPSRTGRPTPERHADMEFLAREVAALRMRPARWPPVTSCAVSCARCGALDEPTTIRGPRKVTAEPGRAEADPRTMEHHGVPLLDHGSSALARSSTPRSSGPITDLGMVEDVDVDGPVRDREDPADGRRLPDEGAGSPTTSPRRSRGRRRDRRGPRPWRHDRRAARKSQGPAGRARPSERSRSRSRIADQGVRDRLGQGRRRQVVGHREPGDRDGRPRLEGRA